MKRLYSIACALALVATGCGDFGAGDDDGGGNTDAGANTCSVTVTVTPIEPEAPVTLVASADIQQGGQVGLVVIDWTVTGPDGTDIDVPATNPVDIPAPVAGNYAIQAHVTIGGNYCNDGYADPYVGEPGAQLAPIRLRYTPLPEHPAPPQDDATLFMVPGGADKFLGGRTLDGGQLIAGHLAGPAGGLGAELRIVPASGGREQVLYASGSGDYGGRLVTGQHVVTVVPYDYAIAPARFDAQSPSMVGAGYTLDAGQAVTGVVLGPGGAPVAGAWVAVSSGALPPSLAQTAADGSFSARARDPLGALRVSVVPPDASGLSRLSAGAALNLSAAAGPLELRLADVPVADVSANVKTSGGAPLPGARVTFLSSSIAAGGSVAQGGPALAAQVTARVTAVADGAGHVDVALPYGAYDVVIEPGANAPVGELVELDSVDVTTGAPAQPLALATRTATPVSFLVEDPAGQPVTGARVTAVSRGAFGVGVGAILAKDTDDVQGGAELALAPGVIYDVVVEAPHGVKLARTTVMVNPLTQAGPVAVVLPAGLVLSGMVLFGGSGGQPGIRVTALCGDCTGAAASAPLAETVTGAGGGFELVIPDPGVSP